MQNTSLHLPLRDVLRYRLSASIEAFSIVRTNPFLEDACGGDDLAGGASVVFLDSLAFSLEFKEDSAVWWTK